MDEAIKNIVYIISLIIGLPLTILLILKTKKEIAKLINKSPLVNLPRHSNLCLGRADEIEFIQKNIITNKSVFICGSAGIGKTTLIAHAIKTITIKKLKSKYDDVLYFDFAENANFEYACNILANQIKEREIKDIRALLNEKQYLIWLDSCEKAKDLYSLICLSAKPVFIISSRDIEQVSLLKPFEDIELILEVSILNQIDAIKLIGYNFNKKTKTKYSIVNSKIVEFLGFHPFLIYLAKNDDLYKKEPEKFYSLLQKEGLDILKEDKNSKIFKEGHNLDFLLKRAIGLDVNSRTVQMSSNAQEFLGLLGCIADEEFIDMFIFKRDKKVVKELLKANLVSYYNKNTFKLKHSYIHEYLSENSETLMRSFTPAIELLREICYTHNYITKTNNYSVIFIYKNHLLSLLKYIISKISITDNDTCVIISYSLQVLAEIGYYKETLNLISLLELKAENLLNRERLSFAKLISYDGLSMHEKAISIAKIEYENNPQKISGANNLLTCLVKYKYFDDANVLIQNLVKTIKFNKIDIYNPDTDINWCYIFALILEYEYLNNKDNQEQLIKPLIDIYTILNNRVGIYDKATIDSGIVLSFILFDQNQNDKAKLIMYEIIRILLDTYSLKDPDILRSIARISTFFYEKGNIVQACEFLKLITISSENYFGHEHEITKKYRQQYLDCNQKKEVISGNNNDIIFKTIDYSKSPARRSLAKRNFVVFNRTE